VARRRAVTPGGSSGAALGARGSASRVGYRTTERCAASVRGGDTPRRKAVRALLESVWSGRACSFGSLSARLVSPGLPREGTVRGEGASRGSSPPGAARGIDAPAVGARASSSLQKSAERPRAQRSASPRSVGSKSPRRSTERVNGSLTTHGLTRASAGARARRMGGGPSVCGDPHHVSAAERGRSRGFVRASARAGCARWMPAEGTLDRGSARLSRGSRGTDLGGLRVTARHSPEGDPPPRRGGGDRVSEVIAIELARGSTTPACRDGRSPK